MFRIRVRVRFRLTEGLNISGAGGPGVGRRGRASIYGPTTTLISSPLLASNSTKNVPFICH